MVNIPAQSKARLPPGNKGNQNFAQPWPGKKLPSLQGGSNAGRGLPNPNSEDRNPKEVRKPKPEFEKLVACMLSSGFRPSGFGAVHFRPLKWHQKLTAPTGTKAYAPGTCNRPPGPEISRGPRPLKK
jgi:hypothetical protein